jgi:hypothetical protein
VNIGRKGKVHGLVNERTRIGAHFKDNLKTLGLKRVARESTLEDYIAEKYGNRESTDNENEPASAVDGEAKG